MTDTSQQILASELNSKISKLLHEEASLDRGYVTVGTLLNEMREKQLWKVLGYESFGKYLNKLSETYNKGRTQLYHYFATVRELAPYITSEQLAEIGISKAAVLAKYVKKDGVINDNFKNIVSQAKDNLTTASTLRKLLFDQTNQPEKGTWLDQEGFYVTDEEKLVILSADDAALKTDPVVPVETPDWVKRKESRLRQAMEYLAAHSR